MFFSESSKHQGQAAISEGSTGVHQVAFLDAIPDASLGHQDFHHYSFM